MSVEFFYTFGLAFVVSAIGLFLLWPAAVEYGLVDRPDQRKQHKGEVPLIGGVCIFLGVWATLLVPGVDNPSNLYIYLIVLLLTGIADDFLGLSVASRIFIQLLVALLVCTVDSHLITYAGNILGFGGIGAGVFAIPITVLAIVTAVNAFNMIDGIDGLAGSLAMVTFASLAAIFAIYGMYAELTLCLAFIGALIPFLLSNFPVPPFKRKIFMGDAGSILIGFCIVWLLIAGSQPADRASPQSNAFYPVTALWLVGVPLFDLMSVSIRRILRGKSPLSGDRDHIHHLLLGIGAQPRTCVLICVAMELVLSLEGIAFEIAAQETASFLIFWLTFIAYFAITSFLSKKIDKQHVQESNNLETA